MKPEEVKTVGVAGCGIMGSGIVEVCAKVGLNVVSVEVAVERGKLDDSDRQAAVSRVSFSTDLGDFADVDLVIEAVTEDLTVKKQVFARLDELIRPDVVLATNTSSLPI